MSSFIETNSSGAKRETLNILQAQREVLELEAEAIGNELLSPGSDGAKPAGIKDPLVDTEGYSGLGLAW